MTLDEDVRYLEHEDLPSALELSTAAGWNQTQADWSMLLALAPKSCFAVKCGGTLAATATLVCHGERLAWLGMVLTRAEYRGRGFATRLVEHALATADRLRIETVKLDATDAGLPIYTRFGFRAEQPIERWTGHAAHFYRAHEHEHAESARLTLREVPQFDCQYFGADRSGLLAMLSANTEPLVVSGGFLMQRPGRHAHYLGACVAAGEDAAQRLFERALDASRQPFCWDLLPSNHCALRLAQKLGFRLSRRLTRMVRGEELIQNSAGIYAAAGFELG